MFRPWEGTDKFSNGVVLAIQGRLRSAELARRKTKTRPIPGWRTRTGDDGVTWSAPRGAGRRGPGRAHAFRWRLGGRTTRTLVTYINAWPTGFQSGEGGHTSKVHDQRRDGTKWAGPWRVRGKDGEPVEGIIEQDPHRMSDGTLLTSFSPAAGLCSLRRSTLRDRLGVRGWQKGEIRLRVPMMARASREARAQHLSPGQQQDQCAVMVFRDQAESFHQLAARSCDRGRHWSEPGRTCRTRAPNKVPATCPMGRVLRTRRGSNACASRLRSR